MATNPPRCLCGNPATNQAIYERDDGSHFLGSLACDGCRSPLGPLQYAKGSQIVDHMEVR